jgi:hypothetical protein
MRSSHGAILRSRFSKATFDSDASPTVSAHAAVSRKPVWPRQ